MKGSTQPIPEHLIYEMVDGVPIYYKGYKEYLREGKKNEAVMGSSVLQSAIIMELAFLLKAYFGKKNHILINDLGLKFKKNSWRAADLAIVEKDRLGSKVMEDKYLDIPPKFVIEIDTKADLESINDTFGYYHKKTNELLDFGVERVIWIFTEQKSVMLADREEPWQIIDWQKSFFIEDLEIKLDQLIQSLLQ
ncbi:MAG: Uma2 family endonuclease [Bacteroidota bacterium]